MYSLAKCCNPIPGDDVFGFVSTAKGLIIHRTSCPNATQLLANYGHRVVKTKWAKNKEISFLTLRAFPFEYTVQLRAFSPHSSNV